MNSEDHVFLHSPQLCLIGLKTLWVPQCMHKFPSLIPRIHCFQVSKVCTGRGEHGRDLNRRLLHENVTTDLAIFVITTIMGLHMT